MAADPPAPPFLSMTFIVKSCLATATAALVLAQLSSFLPADYADVLNSPAELAVWTAIALSDVALSVWVAVALPLGALLLWRRQPRRQAAGKGVAWRPMVKRGLVRVASWPSAGERRINRLKTMGKTFKNGVISRYSLSPARRRPHTSMEELTNRIKEPFGRHIAVALNEPSSIRWARSSRMAEASERGPSRETLPRRPTASKEALEASELPEGLLPTDRAPWDRLHVWLVAGEGMPHRPKVWPFEPYVVVTASGADTGSSAALPIGTYEFQVRAPYMHATRPVWDERGMLCYRRGGAREFIVEVMGSGKLWSGLYHSRVLSPAALLSPASLLRAAVSLLAWLPLRIFGLTGSTPTSDGASFPLPAAGGEWEEVRVPLSLGGFILLRVRVTAWEATPAANLPPPLAAHSQRVEGPSKRLSGKAWELEHVILRGSADARGVLSFRCAPGPQRAKRALLWLPGRNDAFYHSHVGLELAALGIDLYVLSYRRVGECRRLGLFDNPMHNSHCSSGDFAEFRVDIQQALAEMRARGSYEQIIGYGHSTGAPILLDYLMEFGDGDFSGFVFNSPFLDWGWVGGSLAKMVVVHAPALFTRLGLWTETSELLGGGGFNVWALQLYSQYQFDPSCRPLYQVPVTIGYCTGINRVHADLRRRSAAGVPVTRKPFLVLTSKGDDVLNGDETMQHAHAIGPSRTLIELMYARHDVFVSAEPEIVTAAITYLRTWLVSQNFADEPGRDAGTRPGAGQRTNQLQPLWSEVERTARRIAGRRPSG